MNFFSGGFKILSIVFIAGAFAVQMAVRFGGVALAVRLVNISDTLTLSVKTRGFINNDVKPSCYKKINFTMKVGSVLQIIDKQWGKRADKKWFKICGVVYQNPNYQLFMPNVKDEILFGADDKEYALSLAKKFELEPLFSRHPHSLSEGQKPKLLLLNEPTVGQNYKTLQNMMMILNTVHREQENTMISITHDIR